MTQTANDEVSVFPTVTKRSKKSLMHVRYYKFDYQLCGLPNLYSSNVLPKSICFTNMAFTFSISIHAS